MILSEILKNPVSSLQYMERFVNDGSISGFTWKYMTSPNTSPVSDSKYFNLYKCEVPSDWVVSIGEIPNFLQSQGEMDFILIHPDMYNHFFNPNMRICESKFKVIPTASSRTVQILDYHNEYIKLHYDGIIGRIKRELTLSHAWASIEITSVLLTAFENDDFDDLCILPETGAKVIYNNSNQINCGMVIRKGTPFGKRSEQIKSIIPFFSLFSRDRKNEEHPSILKQLIDYHGASPSDFVLDNIIFPLIKNYFSLIRKVGLQAELHSQNMLIGINERYEIISIVLRDIESIDIDKTQRDRIGFTKEFKCNPYKHIDETQYNYQIKHSFMFDYKLCEYSIMPVLNSIEKDFKVSKDILIDKVRDYVNSCILRLPEDFFPDSWYAFENTIIDRTTTKRPYINMGKPKFRDI
jgi:siderophore synthetase component